MAHHCGEGGKNTRRRSLHGRCVKQHFENSVAWRNWFRRPAGVLSKLGEDHHRDGQRFLSGTTVQVR
jgi:hypothetical protein